MSGLFSRPFLLLLLAQTSFGFSFSSFFLLPKFVTQELHGSPSEVGLVAAAFGPTSILLIPLIGSWVDRFGRRPFMIAGALVMALVALAFLAVDRVGPLLYALRLLQGVAFALVFIAASTLVTDLAPAERMGQALGLFGVSMLSMHALAPALAEEVAERAGWPPVFVLAAAAAAVCAVLSARIRETRHAEALEPGPGLLAVALRPRSLRIAFVIALSGAAFGAMMTYPQAFALELGRSHVRGFFVAYACAAVALRLGLGSAVDRLGRHRVSIASLAAYGVVVLAMSRLTAERLEPLGLAFGVAHGFFYPAFNALAVETAAPNERGKVMALFNGGFNLGNASATLALGFVAERAGYPAVFEIAAAGVLVGWIVLVLSPEGRGRAQAEPVISPETSRVSQSS